VKEGFTDAAVPSAVRAYLETYRFLEQEGAYESYGQYGPEAPESSPNQQLGERPIMQPQASAADTARTRPQLHAFGPVKSGVGYHIVDGEIHLFGKLRNKDEAQRHADFILGLKVYLPEEPASEPSSESPDAD
jgi:hypothetical protein